MTARSRREQLQEWLAEDPTDAFLRYGLAMEYVSEGADENAVRCFEELRATAPEYVPAYLQEGQALMRLGRHSDARGVFMQGVQAAQREGNEHAAGEMQAFLSEIR